MKARNDMVLPTVDINDAEAIRDALSNQRGFVLNMDENFKNVTDGLFEHYDAFRAIADSTQYPYAIGKCGPSGYLDNKDDSVQFGNKVGPRLYLNNLESEQRLPVSIWHGYHALLKCVNEAIQKSFFAMLEATTEEAKEVSSNFRVLSTLHHYNKIDSDKLEKWAELGLLTKGKSKDSNTVLEAMAAHKDTSCLTLLIYRGGSAGLQVRNKADGNFYDVVLDQTDSPKLIVLAGREIEYVTSNEKGLKGLTHRVIPMPDLERDVINMFVNLNVPKYTHLPTKGDKSMYRELNTDNFMGMLGHMMFVQNHEQNARRIKKDELPPDILESFKPKGE